MEEGKEKKPEMLISPIRVEGWKLCANAIQFSQVSWKTVQRERPSPWCARNTGQGGMLSSPLVGLRPLSMLRLEDCHYFAISAQSETFERIVYLSRYSIFSLSFPSLLYFSPVRPTFMKNHSHNARTYGGHCAILLSPLSKKGHAFFFLSFFFSFTIDLGR